ncbi:unnamed protein product [Amoebophrya sp. A120]|nr:unnamed protein product [Amoebophrya sp. A120]|eukprot:GSA120T00001827001.1
MGVLATFAHDGGHDQGLHLLSASSVHDLGRVDADGHSSTVFRGHRAHWHSYELPDPWIGSLHDGATGAVGMSRSKGPRRASRAATSFVYCPTCDQAKIDAPHDMPMPGCLEKGEICQGAELPAAKKFIRGIHDTIGTALFDAAKARGLFERRACDFKIAESRGLTAMMEEYGKDGRKGPGGSYIWYLLQYRRSLETLQKSCEKSHSCAQLVNQLQEKEELRPGGRSELPIKFHLWNEMSKGCDFFDKKRPVPNDQEAWCNPAGQDCEVKSCRQWWRKQHPMTTTAGKLGWQDDHPVYGLFQKFCRYLRKTERIAKPLAEQWEQEKQIETAEKAREAQCNPARILGFCEDPTEAGSTAKVMCKLQGGGFCPNGKVVPGGKMAMDTTLFGK